MKCTDCGREHIHEPGGFFIVDMHRLKNGVWLAVIHTENPIFNQSYASQNVDCVIEACEAYAQEQCKGLHIHWPGDVTPPPPDKVESKEAYPNGRWTISVGHLEKIGGEK